MVLELGERHDEISTGGYYFLREATVIHVLQDADSAGTLGRRVLAITANPTAFAKSLAARDVKPGHDERVANLHRTYLGLSTPEEPFKEGGVNISAALSSVARHAPADTDLITESANFARGGPC